jgi:hypothetical protein
MWQDLETGSCMTVEIVQNVWARAAGLGLPRLTCSHASEPALDDGPSLLAIKNPRRGVDLQDETFSTQISFATRDLLF